MILWFSIFCSSLVFVTKAEFIRTGPTCNKTIILSCPSSQRLIIFNVIYSRNCNNSNSADFCAGYDLEPISELCNGQKTCQIDHSLDSQSSFVHGEANCGFKTESIDIEYSCIPDFYSSLLPRVDICTLQSVDEIREGFIHSPNYPYGFFNDATCSKTIPAPDINHRLKIFLIDANKENLISRKNVPNDDFQINEHGDLWQTMNKPYHILFNDVIEATLSFRSSSTKRKNFLLYFSVVPVRKFRKATTTTTTTIFSSTVDEKFIPLTVEKKNADSVGLKFTIVLLVAMLLITLTGLLLYKRRNDRRIRYFALTFGDFFRGSTEQSVPVQHQPIRYEEVLITSNLLSDCPAFKQDENHIYSDEPCGIIDESTSQKIECTSDGHLTSIKEISKQENIYETTPQNLGAKEPT